MPPPAFTLHTSFSPLLPLYGAFLLDQFGVIHNGSQSLHGSVDCIQAMLDRGKTLAILSNTSSPAHVAVRRLKKYGLRGDMFAGGLVSSGDECAKYVREKYCRRCDEGGPGAKTKKALWFTWKESETQNPLEFLSYIMNGINGDDKSIGGRYEIALAESVEEADLILLHGSEVWRRRRELQSSDECLDLNFLYSEDFSRIDPLLDQALERNLPMVCANPDLVVGLPGGVVGNMPGKIAERYAQMGGTVHNFGKPSPRHFHACLDNLGIVYDPNAKSIPGVAHVGDSLEHDVAGANAAGIDSVFVLGGIHARDIGLVPTGIGAAITEDDDFDAQERAFVSKKELDAKLNAFFQAKGIWPTHVVPSLSLARADFILAETKS